MQCIPAELLHSAVTQQCMLLRTLCCTRRSNLENQAKWPAVHRKSYYNMLWQHSPDHWTCYIPAGLTQAFGCSSARGSTGVGVKRRCGCKTSSADIGAAGAPAGGDSRWQKHVNISEVSRQQASADLTCITAISSEVQCMNKEVSSCATAACAIQCCNFGKRCPQ